jgi:phosphoenolpyruvate-protein kinase (PTS system EI component)
MIEVPAAAVVSHALAAHADFFSVGTNDPNTLWPSTARTPNWPARPTACIPPCCA